MHNRILFRRKKRMYEILSFAAKCFKLDIIGLTKISHIEKDK